MLKWFNFSVLCSSFFVDEFGMVVLLLNGIVLNKFMKLFIVCFNLVLFMVCCLEDSKYNDVNVILFNVVVWLICVMILLVSLLIVGVSYVGFFFGLVL